MDLTAFAVAAGSVMSLLGGIGLIVLLVRLNRRRHFGTPADQATFRTLHTAALASRPLRTGLHPASAERSVRQLRTLLGTDAVALTGTEAVLAWDGTGTAHQQGAVRLAEPALQNGGTEVLWTHHAGQPGQHTPSDAPDHVTEPGRFDCAKPDCPIRQVVITPLTVSEHVVGTLQAYTREASAGLVRTTVEVARWVSVQLELAELDRSRTQAMQAEVRALRAQISPHFIYNSLTAIASFVRTDPERARELLTEFAAFTRYSFRRQGEFTTLAEELRSIDRYLLLEKARFGERLDVTLQVAPEVLPVAIPFLSLQPLVENAVRHGLAGKAGAGRIVITAADEDSACLLSVEDDGVGMDPDVVRRALSGDPEGDSVGLGNVDERLRGVFGEEHGLSVETAPGAGTKVSMRVPKFHPGVHATS